MTGARFRDLPAVHLLLARQRAIRWMDVHGRGRVVQAVQRAVDEAREQLRAGHAPDLAPNAVLDVAERHLQAAVRPHFQPVINATGTVLHTNLGRAPLAEEALAAIALTASGYSNLEYDLDTGERGLRHDHVEPLICRLTGAEAALVVNNNAAAVFLTLAELAQGRKVAISRGELVEIGGSFRVSEVMRQSGATLIEVGTTNKTREADYEAALKDGADMVLRVHTSNFRIVGFTSKPALAALADLAHRYGALLVEDLGSGSLADLRARGVGDEPTIGESVRAGVDIVTFSGDKLLGAGQAGVICGRREFVARIRKNQLARAVRVDKLTLAALEATLRLYEDERATYERVPVLWLLTRPVEELEAIAGRLAGRLTNEAPAVRCRAIATIAQVGGGALPSEQLPSWGVAAAISGVSAERFTAGLRAADPPIVARVAREEVIFDVRTVFSGEFERLVSGIAGVVARLAAGRPADHAH